MMTKKQRRLYMKAWRAAHPKTRSQRVPQNSTMTRQEQRVNAKAWRALQRSAHPTIPAQTREDRRVYMRNWRALGRAPDPVYLEWTNLRYIAQVLLGPNGNLASSWHA